MTNAKEELERILSENNLVPIAWKIINHYRFWSRYNDCKDLIEKIDYFVNAHEPYPTIDDYDRLNYSHYNRKQNNLKDALIDLDFDYDSNYCGEKLHGVVVCEDGYFLTRHEYDGAEKWVINKYPDLELFK